MNYKLTKNYAGEEVGVNKISGGTILSIPKDPDNTDYQAFLKYQAEGGKVYAADETIPADEVTE